MPLTVRSSSGPIVAAASSRIDGTAATRAKNISIAARSCCAPHDLGGAEPGYCPFQQGLRDKWITGDEVRPGGGEQPAGAMLGVGGELRGPQKEGSLRRVAAATPGPLGRVFELRRDVLVDADGRRGEVPRPAVRITVGVDHGREGLVHAPPIRRPRPRVDRRTDEGMTEGETALEREDALRHGDVRRLGRQAEKRGGPPQQRGVVRRRDRGDEQQRLRLRRHGADLTQEVLLHAPAHRQRPGQQGPVGELLTRQLVRQLDHREGIAPGLGDDPLDHLGAEPTGDGGQQPEGVRLGQTGDVERGQPAERQGAGRFVPDGEQ